MTYRLMPVFLLLLSTGHAQAGEPQAAQTVDPHYNEAGFFDIHVCNWPDRPVFFMPLFSTTQGDAVRSIEVLTPDNRPLVQLDLSRFRSIEQKNKPDKRVFINQINIPPEATDGWYSARITLNDGRRFTAKDYVAISRLAQAGGQVPADGAEVALPDALRWQPVPDASFYQVFIRDLWDDDRLIYTSKLIERPELALPPGLLKPGGYYSWIIHAR
ncbi:MAG: hypothetical protein ACC648_05165, partial [Thiohalobacterales bacterium]